MQHDGRIARLEHLRRRHERRRRKAEEQLTESETNLARVEDILAELRPQARRLAAQAEQQATRVTAGDELASALLAAAHVRWHEAARRAASPPRASIGSVTRRTRRWPTSRRPRRPPAPSRRSSASARPRNASVWRRTRSRGRLSRSSGSGRRGSPETLEAIDRDRARLTAEREAAEASLAIQRRGLAIPVPPRDHDLDAASPKEIASSPRQTPSSLALRTASRARGEEAAAIRRAEAARQAEAETAGRRLAEAPADSTAETHGRGAVDARRGELEGRAADGTAPSPGNAGPRNRDGRARGGPTAGADADARRRSRGRRGGRDVGNRGALRARLSALDDRLREDEERGIARAARRRGGRRLDDELVVDPALRPAVEAALDELARAYLVDAASASGLGDERGALVIRERAVAAAGGNDAATRRFLDRLAEVGGSPLGDAIRRDPSESVRRVLARSAVVADLGTALALQADLPAGWSLVTHDGGAVVTELAVRLGRGDAPLERRAEADRLRGELATHEQHAAAMNAEAETARAEASRTRSALDAASAAEATAAAERRRADEAERSAARELEAVTREAGWHAAQVARLETDVERARDAVTAGESGGLWGAASAPSAEDGGAAPNDEAAALAAWDGRIADLRSRRDRLAAEVAAADADRREIEARRARAEATVAMDEGRIVAAGRELATLVERAERDRRGAPPGWRGAGRGCRPRGPSRRRARRRPRRRCRGPRPSRHGGAGAPARRAIACGLPTTASARPIAPTSRPGWVATRSGAAPRRAGRAGRAGPAPAGVGGRNRAGRRRPGSGAGAGRAGAG